MKKKKITSPFRLEIQQWRGEINFREKNSNFSLDFPAFGLLVLIGPRGKVVLRCKGYAWTPVLWSFDNSER